MKRINTPTSVDGKFVDGNGREQKATQFSAEWCNQVQEELCNLIKKWTGGDPTGNSDHELADAVAKYNPQKPLVINGGSEQGVNYKMTLDGTTAVLESRRNSDNSLNLETIVGISTIVMTNFEGEPTPTDERESVTLMRNKVKFEKVFEDRDHEGRAWNVTTEIRDSGEIEIAKKNVDAEGNIYLTKNLHIDTDYGVWNNGDGEGFKKLNFNRLSLVVRNITASYAYITGTFDASDVVNLGAADKKTTSRGPMDVKGTFDASDTVNLGAAASGNVAAKKTTVRGGLKVTGGASIDKIDELCLRYGVHGDDGLPPIIETQSNIDISGYTDYPDGSVLRIINSGNSTVTITYSSGLTFAIDPFSFREVVRFDNDWYKDSTTT